MKRFFRFALFLACVGSLTGCATHDIDQRADNAEPLASHPRVIATEVADCLERLGKLAFPAAQELDARSIGLVSWNVKKGGRPDWRYDLEDLRLGTDLVLMQEAALPPGYCEAQSVMEHWSFAPGYRTAANLTGVMTYSNSPPLTHCNLTNREPWLGTPKATGITEYGLMGTDETLVVVNIHAINFTFGVAEFTSQLEQLRPVLATHDGPTIFSGDFNTWRIRRSRILDSFAREFGLEPVAFEADNRKMFNGQPLDHIYVRGLTVESSETRIVESSDHNPLFVELRL